MNNLLNRLRRNVNKTNLKEINGMDTRKEQEEFADIMCDALSQMDTPENMSRLEAERLRREELLLAYTGKLSDDSIKQIVQLHKYISHLLREINNNHRKNSLYTLIAQVAYASILISDTASKYFDEKVKIPTEMEMEPEIEVNGSNDIKRALSVWISYMERNKDYLSASLKTHDNRRVYEACMNYGWIGSNQSTGISAYMREYNI